MARKPCAKILPLAQRVDVVMLVQRSPGEVEGKLKNPHIGYNDHSNRTVRHQGAIHSVDRRNTEGTLTYPWIGHSG